MPSMRNLAACLRPWAEVTSAQLAGLRGVLTDIDDTLTRDGAIEPAALVALHDLAAAGLPVIAITGRPSGWSEAFALQWPVAAIVAENGAVMLRRAGVLGASLTAPLGAAGEAALQRDFIDDAVVRAANAKRLQACAADVLAHVPGATLARDSAGRLTDIAVDHSEFVTLAPEGIAQVVALMQRHGLTATVSSIHINGWIGAHNKFSGAQWAVQRALGLAFRADHWLFVGDSTNDQVMFERLPMSVGVANIARFVHQLAHAPAFVTQAERGQGFAEVAAAVLTARRHDSLPLAGGARGHDSLPLAGGAHWYDSLPQAGGGQGRGSNA